MLKSHQSNWNVSDRSIFFLLLEEKYWHNNFFVDRFVGAVQENNRTFLVCYGNGISFETFWSLRTNCALQFRDMCKYCGKFTSDTGDSAHDAVSSGEGGGPRDFHRHTSFTLAEIQFSSKNVQMAAFAYYKLQNAVRDARLMQLIRITSRHWRRSIMEPTMKKWEMVTNWSGPVIWTQWWERICGQNDDVAIKGG